MKQLKPILRKGPRFLILFEFDLDNASFHLDINRGRWRICLWYVALNLFWGKYRDDIIDIFKAGLKV
jgi:hypothetical protein